MKHKGDRETSFIDKEVSTWLEANREGGCEAKTNGLCLHRFHADFVIDLKGIKTGDLVEICGRNKGDAVEPEGDYEGVSSVSAEDKQLKTIEKYEITSIGKRCFPECELLKETGKPCPLKDGVAFGKQINDI